MPAPQNHRYRSLALLTFLAVVLAPAAYAQGLPAPTIAKVVAAPAPVTLNTPAGIATPVAASAPVAVAPAQAPANEIPPGVILKPVPDPTTPSLFFTPAQVQAISAAIHTYNDNKIKQALDAARPKTAPQPRTQNARPSDDYLTTLTNQAKKNLPGIARAPSVPKSIYNYPQFYMEYMMYHSATNWTVLINGQKFSSAVAPDKNADLRVVTVDHERVIFEWKPKNMDRITEAWDGEPSFTVSPDLAAGTVTFSLRLNQTFSSYLMKVVEGKVTPVHSRDALPINAVVAVPGQAPQTDDSASAPDDTSDAAAPEDGDSQPGDEDNGDDAAPQAQDPSQPIILEQKPAPANNGEGLGGLLNDYKSLSQEKN